jgi:signal transduction histidine kinase
VAQLVRNACEAHDGAGTVTVTARPDADDQGRVAICVRDDGRGMDAETLRRCTDPLFTTKPSADANGLGLPIVHIAVTQAGGELHLASRPGRGTRATLLLPAADQGSNR